VFHRKSFKVKSFSETSFRFPGIDQPVVAPVAGVLHDHSSSYWGPGYPVPVRKKRRRNKRDEILFLN